MTERGLAVDHLNLGEGRNRPYAGQRIAGSCRRRLSSAMVERACDMEFGISKLLRRFIASRNRGRRPDSRITWNGEATVCHRDRCMQRYSGTT